VDAAVSRVAGRAATPAKAKKKGTKARKAAKAVAPAAAGRKRPRGTPAFDPSTVDAARYREFGRRLRAWYRRHARDLPWRRTRDPYRVLVSELMLQQTQVARVVDYYATFLARFPTLRHVAEAEVHDVTAAWRGLGYYARARNLHALARRVAGAGAAGTTATLPAEPAALRALPGVGAYTAGAVASFAYERRAPLVDTNVARVLRRVFAPDLVPKSGAESRAAWALAEATLPRTGRDAWTHNQALMELGALVCTARLRHCAGCPVQRVCETNARIGCDEGGRSAVGGGRNRRGLLR
jgi:A/G-specific adenine glycosylase